MNLETEGTSKSQRLEKSKSSRKCNSKYWKRQEDLKLITLVDQYGENFEVISSHMRFTPVEIKERYEKKIKSKLDFTQEEDHLLISLASRTCDMKEIRKSFPYRSKRSLKTRINELNLVNPDLKFIDTENTEEPCDIIGLRQNSCSSRNKLELSENLLSKQAISIPSLIKESKESESNSTSAITHNNIREQNDIIFRNHCKFSEEVKDHYSKKQVDFDFLMSEDHNNNPFSSLYDTANNQHSAKENSNPFEAHLNFNPDHTLDGKLNNILDLNQDYFSNLPDCNGDSFNQNCIHYFLNSHQCDFENEDCSHYGVDRLREFKAKLEMIFRNVYEISRSEMAIFIEKLKQIQQKEVEEKSRGLFLKAESISKALFDQFNECNSLNPYEVESKQLLQQIDILINLIKITKFKLMLQNVNLN